MILKEVEIVDFKSVKQELVEIKSNQLCLVGINESGKTSIIEAISFLNIHKDFQQSYLNKDSSRYPNNYPIISGVFAIDKKEEVLGFLKEVLNISKSIDLTNYSKPLFIQLKRWGNGFNNLSLVLSDEGTFQVNITDSLKEPKDKSVFFDVFFEKYYPEIEFYEKEELLIEPASADDLNGDDPKYETLRRLLRLGGCNDFNHLNSDDLNYSATYRRRIERTLNGIFKKHYKQDESIALALYPVANNKIVLLISDASGMSFSINERSPGFQYYFSFLVNKLYFTQFKSNKNIVFLLDEPGTSLHPHGSRDLLRTFTEIAKKSQIIYTTHNPFLTIRDNIDSLLFVYKKPSEGTRINSKPWLNKYQILRKELGILLNDSFLIGDMNLMVEGITEKSVIHEIIQTERFSHLEWVNIYNADGVGNISQALNYLGSNNLNLRGVALIDSDSEGETEKGKSGFKNAMNTDSWEYVEINDVFKDKKERTFEDLFPQDLYIQAFNEYCKSIENIGVFDKQYQPYIKTAEIPLPIINSMKTHFFSFVPAERKKHESISKQVVMSFLFKILETKDQVFRKDALTKVFELVDLIDKKIKIIESHGG